jgi:hypothetical protein
MNAFGVTVNSYYSITNLFNFGNQFVESLMVSTNNMAV